MSILEMLVFGWALNQNQAKQVVAKLCAAFEYFIWFELRRKSCLSISFPCIKLLKRSFHFTLVSFSYRRSPFKIQLFNICNSFRLLFSTLHPVGMFFSRLHFFFFHFHCGFALSFHIIIFCFLQMHQHPLIEAISRKFVQIRCDKKKTYTTQLDDIRLLKGNRKCWTDAFWMQIEWERDGA